MEVLKLFKEQLPLGINGIFSKKDIINAINTFPVEDADTGSNILYTLEGINSVLQSSLGIQEILDTFLYTSKGSSGNIISLYLLKLLGNLSSTKEINKQIFEDSYNFLLNSYPYIQEKGTLVETFYLLPLLLESEESFYKNLYCSTVLSIEDTYNRTKKCLPDSGILASLYFFTSILDNKERYTFNFNKELLDKSLDSKKDSHLWCCEILLEDKDYSSKVKSLLKDTKESEKFTFSINNKTKFHIHLRDNDLLELFRAFRELNINPLKIKVDFMY